ncbi:MAG: FtsX-like permease family protein [Pseudomonadota bacterium]
MTAFWWTLRTLLSDWRRRPAQALMFLAGLASATALFSGVQALNFQARQSYAEAASQLGGAQLASVRTPSETPFDQRAFIALRKAGYKVSPVVEGDILIGRQPITVIGIDLATLPAAAAGDSLQAIGGNGRQLSANTDLETIQPADFLLPPGVGLVAPETLTKLSANEGDRLRSSTDQLLPPLQTSAGITPDTIITDIAPAQMLLSLGGKISRLLVDETQATGLPPLAKALGDLETTALKGLAPAGLALNKPTNTNDMSRLTDSFHLNLTAFGFLSFFVGLLIVHGAVGLVFEQRRTLMRTMRACGVSSKSLTIAAATELLLLATAAGAVGLAIGYTVAGALLPDVAVSLRSLYGAKVAGALAFRPTWLALGLFIAVAGAAAAAAGSLYKTWKLPVLAPGKPTAWRAAEQQTIKRNALFAGFFFATALGLLLAAGGLFAGFALMGASLLAAALILPAILSVLLRLAEANASGPIVRWFFADGRQQLPSISLALQALLIALAVNIGVGSMVGGFRATFLGWLDQRLAAELYVNAGAPGRAIEMRALLEAQDAVTAILPLAFASTRFNDLPAELYGFTDHETYRDSWPLLAQNPGAWDRVTSGEAIFINEQLFRGDDIKVGERITLEAPTGPWAVEVAGVYSDYGNTRAQFMVAVDTLKGRWPDAQGDLFILRVEKESVDRVAQLLTERFQLTDSDLINQTDLKALSETIFEKTFTVTAALNVLTLVVAGVALLTGLLSLATARLPQVAPLWACGLTRRRLALLDLLKTLSLAAVTSILAIPLGVAVAWMLTAIINVEAFGWRLPLHHFPDQWAGLIILAVAIAALSSAPVTAALWRASPTRLIKVFADER